jgi:methyl-accepting chemotaxis protein WspA
MQNQSEGAQQISDAMWQLTEMGRQTSESVNDLNDVSQQLHEAVRILKERIIHARNGDTASVA